MILDSGETSKQKAVDVNVVSVGVLCVYCIPSGGRQTNRFTDPDQTKRDFGLKPDVSPLDKKEIMLSTYFSHSD